jgi:hypothetical protein
MAYEGTPYATAMARALLMFEQIQILVAKLRHTSSPREKFEVSAELVDVSKKLLVADASRADTSFAVKPVDAAREMLFERSEALRRKSH